MKLGIILNTNEAESCWNCFRLGNEALAKKHSVGIFLLGKGVEVEKVKDARFPYLEGAIKKFVMNKGALLACGTCLKMREQESTICPISTIENLLDLVCSSDKVATFG